MEGKAGSGSVSTTSPLLPPREVTTAGELVPSLDSLDDEEDSLQIRERRRYTFLQHPSRRYILYALALWITELVLVIVLKHAGVVEQEFRLDEAVKQSVLPQWEQSMNILGRLNESIPLSYLTQEKKRPGFQLAQQGAKAHFPVVMIPGFVTSGLEVWYGKECARKHFRQRLWAALYGARSFLMERDCWKEHMMLDPFTGGDPEGIRLRAATGFEAVDYFMANYWVWGKLIENLADVGYSPSTMTIVPYDWRLSFPMLEKRDGYLSRLKSEIENMHRVTGKKVVLTSHSMGALLTHYFFAWVTTEAKKGGGGGGKKWVDEHLQSYINIAGSHLGVPKAATALLSGEMSDTVFLGTMGSMVEQFFGRRPRRDLWTTWGSLWSMVPKGGDGLWGSGADMCESRTTDDPFCPESGERSPLIAMTDSPKSDTVEGQNQVLWKHCVQELLKKQSHSSESILAFLLSYGGGLGPGIAASKDFSLKGNEKPSSRTWHDPTKTPLPYAPNMEIYCLYGVGVGTERAYYYKRNFAENGESTADPSHGDPPVILDSSVSKTEQNVQYGVRYADGDGSVPLLSLGYICVDAWNRTNSGLNPSRSAVFTREYKHQAEFLVDDPMRSGPRGSDHVDILGNVDMMNDFLRIVTDFENLKVKENKIVSHIERIAAQINSQPRGGGIQKQKRWFL